MGRNFKCIESREIDLQETEEKPEEKINEGFATKKRY